MAGKVLIIDVGTQSMRGVIFDDSGNLLVKEQVKYQPYLAKVNGYMEQSMGMYLDVLRQITNKIFTTHAEVAKDVIAMSVDTFRDTAVLLDEQNQPLRDLILWSDQRVASTADRLPASRRFLFNLVGMKRPINAIRSKVKTRWIQQNEPELWEKVKKVVHISAYFNYFLTGKLVDSYASAIGHLPFFNQKKRWLNEKDLLTPVFDLPLDMMCPLVSPGDLIGTIDEKVSAVTGLPVGLEVFASGSDKGCETLGVGCMSPDVASISFGTSSTVQFYTEKYFEPEPFMPSYPAVVKAGYNPEVQIFRGYWMISWFKQNFAEHLSKKADETGRSVEELMNEEIVSVPAGSDGLILQPFWQAGLTTPEARGAIIGFSDFHKRAHVYRAIIEGIDFALREGLERMERRGKMKIKYLTVSGGGSQSDLICQICADIMNLPVRRVQTYETSGLGGAISVFVAKGVYADEKEAVRHMVHYKDEFLPDATKVKIYDDIYKNIYLKLYAKLQKFYRYLEEI
jgi:sugar (pentulose or hexulose) kinase